MGSSAKLTEKVKELLDDAERIVFDSPDNAGLKVMEAYDLIAKSLKSRSNNDWISARYYHSKKIKYIDINLFDNGFELELKYITFIP